jgi:hypothetical protein
MKHNNKKNNNKKYNNNKKDYYNKHKYDQYHKDNKDEEDRNKVLKQIANDGKTYKITFILDDRKRDNKNFEVRLIGCHGIKITIDNIEHTLGHAWLREDMIDGLIEMTNDYDIDDEVTMYLSVKAYTRQYGEVESNNRNKYEFTNK